MKTNTAFLLILLLHQHVQCLQMSRSGLGTTCDIGQCCHVTLGGQEVQVCPVNQDDVFVHNHVIPAIINHFDDSNANTSMVMKDTKMF